MLVWGESSERPVVAVVVVVVVVVVAYCCILQHMFLLESRLVLNLDVSKRVSHRGEVVDQRLAALLIQSQSTLE